MEIKKKSITIFLFGVIGTLLIACNKESQTSINKLPVVEAYLISGKQLSVKLYYQKSLSDTTQYGSPIIGQELYVSDGDKTIELTETKKGTYTFSDTSFLVVGKTYTLKFNYNLVSVTAKTVIPPKNQNFSSKYVTVNYPGATTDKIDTLNKFTWSNPDSLNHVLVFININGTYTPISTKMSGFRERIYQVDTKRKSNYYITTSDFSYYGQYKVILMSVNQEYIDLVNSDASNSNTEKLLNMPTNVVNGLGIFTAIQTDTLNFNLY